jgi:3-deoxy-D-manno-octulosonic-acid transferase
VDLTLIKLLLFLYNIAWAGAIPLLKRSPRVALGWEQRALRQASPGPFDIWIQAASGGESLLSGMVLDHLAATLPPATQLRVFATSGTQQGIDSLKRCLARHGEDARLELTVAFFPFDAPQLMEKAFALFSPKLAIIVETELWPGFLVTAKRRNVPVLLINGRMSKKSFRSYRRFRRFFRQYGPERVWAISAADGARFAEVLGGERVEVINNLKFDRVMAGGSPPANTAIAKLLPAQVPFVLLGSVRRQEEEKIFRAIAAILARRPDVVIGLFPKHIERAGHWLTLLRQAGIDAVERSAARGPCPPGTVIVWDLFGELAGAYALANTAFVGGSLVELGGQNFLEPLAFGLRPVIGRHWHNFAWVGREIVNCGLVREVADETELVAVLLAAVDAGDSREEVLEQVRGFLAPRQGGTRQVCQHIIDKLHGLTGH